MSKRIVVVSKRIVVVVGVSSRIVGFGCGVGGGGVQ